MPNMKMPNKYPLIVELSWRERLHALINGTVVFHVGYIVRRHLIDAIVEDGMDEKRDRLRRNGRL